MLCRTAVVVALAAIALAVPMAPASAHGYGCGDKAGKHGWAGCRVTPQYFRYQPPSVGPRCFASRYGHLHCPYSARPAWWHGCWMNRYGRMVCQKAKTKANW